METTRLLYHELFTIRFLHDGFGAPANTLISERLKIVPDTETDIILRNLGIGYCFPGEQFVCFVRSKRLAPPANQPLAPVIDDRGETKLRFLLSAGSGFIERTFVVHAGGKLVYHFSNRVNNVDAGPPEMIYLHKKIAPFSIGNDYLAGTIVEDVGDMYAAKKSVNHADNIAVTNLEYWEDVGDQHDEFVNNADLELSRDMNLTQSCFAVIDIWLSGTTGKYRLFDAAGQLLSPVFIISLKSRT